VHHDLVPANVLDTGDRLVLIDWEYAAPGHPDIDRWSVDPWRVTEPFVAEMMDWINGLWERLVRLDEQPHGSG
jgi:aminoglycoside phosphotransferase (APT) family kinase protein